MKVSFKRFLTVFESVPRTSHRFGIAALLAVCLSSTNSPALVFRDNFEGTSLVEGRWREVTRVGETKYGRLDVRSGRLEYTSSYSGAGTEAYDHFDARDVQSLPLGAASADFDFTTEITLKAGASFRLITIAVALSGSSRAVAMARMDRYSGGGPLIVSASPSPLEPQLAGDRVALRFQYEAAQKLLRIFYRDPSSPSAPWNLLASFGLDRDTDGLHWNSDWKMLPNSSFTVNIGFYASAADGSGELLVPVRSGEMAIDNVLFTQPVSMDSQRTVYSSFGDLEEFDPASWANVGWVAGYRRGLAWPFTVPSGKDRWLDSVALPVTRDVGNNLEISVWSEQDGSGSTPKWTKLETLATNPAVRFWTEKYPDVLTFSSKRRPLLMQGRTYWLRLEPANKSFTSSSANCMYSWYNAPSGATPKLAYLPVGAPTKTLPEWTFSSENRLAAFRVEGTPVNESFSLRAESPYWDFRTSPGPAVRLSWDAVAGATGYEIWRDGALIHPLSSLFKGRSFTNEIGLVPGARHRFQIVALTPSGKRVSDPLTLQMPVAPGAAADRPGGLALWTEAIEWSGNVPSVSLRWSDANGENNYEVIRNGRSLVKVGDQRTYRDGEGVRPGSTILYQIRSRNSAGTSVSNEHAVIVPAVQPAGPGEFSLNAAAPVFSKTLPAIPSVTLMWGKSAGAVSYDLYRDSIRVASGLKTLTFTDSEGLTPGLSYNYRAVALNSFGSTSSSTAPVSIPAVSGPPALGSFTLTAGAAYWDDRTPPGPAIRLTWTPSSGAESYAIYRDGLLYRTGIRGTTYLNELDLVPGANHVFIVQARVGGLTRNSTAATALMPSGPPLAGKPLTLTSDVPLTIPAGAEGANRFYTFKVPPNTSRLTVQTEGGSGDIDLYCDLNKPPVPGMSLLPSSTHVGNNETITIENPGAGAVYHFLAVATAPSANVRIVARTVSGTAAAAKPVFADPPGSFAEPFQLGFTHVPDTEIWFNLNDANAPARRVGRLYDPAQKIWISGTTTVRAIAYKEGLLTSEVATQTFRRETVLTPGATQLVPLRSIFLGQMAPWEERVFEMIVPEDEFLSNKATGAGVVGFIVEGVPGSVSGGIDAQIFADDSWIGSMKTLLLTGEKFFHVDDFDKDGSSGTPRRWTIKLRTRGLLPSSGYSVTGYYLPVTIASRSGSVSTGKETWIVCHGRNDRPESFETLASAIDSKSAADQVLLVDWPAAHLTSKLRYVESTKKIERLDPGPSADLSASRFIAPVAKKVRNMLRHYAISEDQIRWVGHSWGSLVGHEFAKSSKKSLGALVALDPASSGWKWLFHDAYDHANVIFTTNASRSWAFVAPSSGVSYGSSEKAATAQHSILLTFTGFQPSSSLDPLETENIAHQRVVSAYEWLMQKNYQTPATSLTADPFSLERLLSDDVLWAPNQINSQGGENRTFMSLADYSFEAKLECQLSAFGEWLHVSRAVYRDKTLNWQPQ